MDLSKLNKGAYLYNNTASQAVVLYIDPSNIYTDTNGDNYLSPKKVYNLKDPKKGVYNTDDYYLYNQDVLTLKRVPRYDSTFQDQIDNLDALDAPPWLVDPLDQWDKYY